VQLREGCKAIQNVVRLAPRKAPYEDAVDAYLAGQPKACLNLLHGHDSASASLLRVRALLRAVRVDEAIVELGQCVPRFGDHVASATHQFLLGTALARRGEYDNAHEALANAQSYAVSTSDRELITEAAYYRALTAFMSGDLAQTEDIASETLDDQGGSAHARLLELLGLVAGLRGDVERQIMMLLAANEHLMRLSARDVWLEASMINNLAIPVAEANPPKIAAFVRDRASAIEWNDELRPVRFHVTHRMAWLDALAGNHLAAYRNFRAAVRLGPETAHRALAFVGLGYLAREMGEAINAAECIAEAEDLVREFDWSTADEVERLVLLHLATLVAPSDPVRAAQHIDRYKTLPKQINSMYSAAHGNPRYRAEEAHAFGAVANARDGAAFARPLLTEAHWLFHSVSSGWRAAAVALDLYEIDGDPAMLTYAREHAARIPHSWLARRVGRLGDSSG